VSRDRYALFGSPIDKSPSPAMHNAAFAALGLDARYELRPAGAGDVPALLAEMQSTWRGANVTIPLKEALAGHVAPRGHAERAHAVNTLWRDGETLAGSLTDVEGVAEPLRARRFAGGPALVLGAGGAARAAVLALEQLGCTITVAARRPSEAERLLRELGAKGEAVALGDAAALARALTRTRVLVQCTPVGRSGEVLPLAWDAVQPGVLAFEMLYWPPRTPFLEAAKQRGCEIIEGWEMLLAQGAAAFTLWTGREAPREVMGEALRADLARRAG
jgi:shikimate dehydrogenase